MFSGSLPPPATLGGFGDDAWLAEADAGCSKSRSISMSSSSECRGFAFFENRGMPADFFPRGGIAAG
jgi:hypothetical protein